jgi:hypothetical protein
MKIIALVVVLMLSISILAVQADAGTKKNNCWGHPMRPINCIHCEPLCACNEKSCEWIWVKR